MLFFIVLAVIAIYFTVRQVILWYRLRGIPAFAMLDFGDIFHHLMSRFQSQSSRVDYVKRQNQRTVGSGSRVREICSRFNRSHYVSIVETMDLF